MLLNFVIENNDDVFEYKGQKCIYVKEFSICITTKKDLKFMVNFTARFADGSFDYAPNRFLQMHTIHCYQNEYCIPIFYLFFENKSK